MTVKLEGIILKLSTNTLKLMVVFSLTLNIEHRHFETNLSNKLIDLVNNTYLETYLLTGSLQCKAKQHDSN